MRRSKVNNNYANEGLLTMKNITPCLWFDSEAEDAANFYVSIFKNSKIKHVGRYTEVGKEHHGKPAGSVMVVSFEINGQEFTALNGGPLFKISEAVSFQVMCENQDEVDYYWEKLTSGGDAKAQACGWLKDKFGVSWQIIPIEFLEIMKGPNAQKATQAMFQMKKLDINVLKRAAEQK
jgi:predicted 3-demethylubiquinone-9 3-methyltransferase (glyoxalase superfamily)